MKQPAEQCERNARRVCGTESERASEMAIGGEAIIQNSNHLASKTKPQKATNDRMDFERKIEHEYTEIT